MTRLQEMKLIAEGSERNRLELQKQLDAQRLRADTAEAERDQAKEERDSFQRVGIAAKQRIAELLQICRDIQDDPRLWLMVNAELSGRIIAALNPNPEAESHE